MSRNYIIYLYYSENSYLIGLMDYWFTVPSAFIITELNNRHSVKKITERVRVFNSSLRFPLRNIAFARFQFADVLQI